MHFREHKLQNCDIKDTPENIIIDIKGGIGDIQALLVAFHLAKKYNKQILGITCVAGGSCGINLAAEDALVACKLSQVNYPIYKGSKQSMLMNTQPSICLGQEQKNAGLSSLRQILNEKDKLCIKSESAMKFIVQCGKKYRKKLGIIALGPLSNIAISYHLDYSLGDIGMISIFGGQYSGVGNVIGQYASQSNFNFDPHAAFVIIKNFNNNVYLNCLQTALEHKPNANFYQLISKASSQRKQHRQQFQKIFGNAKSQFPCHWGQILAVMPMFSKQIVTKQFHVYGQVSLQTNHIEGYLAIDWLRMMLQKNEQPQNIKIYAKFNKQNIEQMIHEMITK